MHSFVALLIGLTASLTGAVHMFLPSHATTTPALPSDTSGVPLRIPIFIYHTIATGTPTETKSQEVFSTEPVLLDQQLTYLDTHGYTTITMKEAADMLRRGTTSPVTKPVVLTFDDGWVTQYKNALPLLEAHHAKAVFYIFPNPIGKDARFMTWEQLATLRDSGMEIADHTLTHPLLSKQTPPMLHHEMYDSKTMLESKLGISVTDFASPFGYTSDAVVAELKADGYETGRTTDRGMVHAATSTYALSGYIVHKGMKDFEWALEYAK
ncbi:MAG: putative xylanase/chitin deacetylase [Parcubacteria group bacterium]|nr:putative xylanase/chitin deacetylase [Parcubacteria group bacterium]